MEKEITFREFYEEDERIVFTKTLKVNFGQCDKNRKMHLSELLLLTSDVGVEDYTLRGITWEVLTEKKVALLVSRTSFHIIKMPVKDQFIRVRTWEEKETGLQFTRRFEILDEKTQEVLVTASTLWILVDLNSRKIIPAAKFDLRDRPQTVSEYAGIAPGKISLPEDAVSAGKRTVRFSDMDANGHMNNSKYGNYIYDCLPEDLQNRDVREIRINYSKEARIGEEIEMKLHVSEEGSRAVVAGIGPSEACFECELTY